MRTSRFQLALISFMAVGLGHALSSADAEGFPAGPSVSVGSNPLWSIGGFRTESGVFDVITAPLEQDMVIQDLIFTTEAGAIATPALSTSGGESLSQFMVFGANYNGGGAFVAHFNGGLKIPAGETLKLATNTGADVYYTVSGYYAQP